MTEVPQKTVLFAVDQETDVRVSRRIRAELPARTNPSPQPAKSGGIVERGDANNQSGPPKETSEAQ